MVKRSVACGGQRRCPRSAVISAIVLLVGWAVPSAIASSIDLNEAVTKPGHERFAVKFIKANEVPSVLSSRGIMEMNETAKSSAKSPASNQTGAPSGNVTDESESSIGEETATNTTADGPFPTEDSDGVEEVNHNSTASAQPSAGSASRFPTQLPSNQSHSPTGNATADTTRSTNATSTPTLRTSTTPTAIPTAQHGTNRTAGPTVGIDIPSDLPSDMPSLVPSQIPSTKLGGIGARPDDPSSTSSFPPTMAFRAPRSPTAVPTLSSRPSSLRSAFPSQGPSSTPSVSGQPSSSLSSGPSILPTESIGPSGVPSSYPSQSLNPSASSQPSTLPSMAPSTNPSANPSLSALPSTSPSAHPSTSPSRSPSQFPSWHPSSTPSMLPSATPSSDPTMTPSSPPSVSPSKTPSEHPSASPSVMPSSVPSSTPTLTCHDNSTYSSPIIGKLKCEDHGDIPCFMWRELGILNTEELGDLINSCPESCSIPCGAFQKYSISVGFHISGVPGLLSPKSMRVLEEVSFKYMTNFIQGSEADGTFGLDAVELKAQSLREQSSAGRRLMHDPATVATQAEMKIAAHSARSTSVRTRRRTQEELLWVNCQFRGFSIGLSDESLTDALVRGIDSPGYEMAIQNSNDTAFVQAQIFQPSQDPTFDADDSSSNRDGASTATVVVATLASISIFLISIVVVLYHRRSGRWIPPLKEPPSMDSEIGLNSPASLSMERWIGSVSQESDSMLSFQESPAVQSSFSGRRLLRILSGSAGRSQSDTDNDDSDSHVDAIEESAAAIVISPMSDSSDETAAHNRGRHDTHTVANSNSNSRRSSGNINITIPAVIANSNSASSHTRNGMLVERYDIGKNEDARRDGNDPNVVTRSNNVISWDANAGATTSGPATLSTIIPPMIVIDNIEKKTADASTRPQVDSADEQKGGSSQRAEASTELLSVLAQPNPGMLLDPQMFDPSLKAANQHWTPVRYDSQIPGRPVLSFGINDSGSSEEEDGEDGSKNSVASTPVSSASTATPLVHRRSQSSGDVEDTPQQGAKRNLMFSQMSILDLRPDAAPMPSYGMENQHTNAITKTGTIPPQSQEYAWAYGIEDDDDEDDYGDNNDTDKYGHIGSPTNNDSSEHRSEPFAERSPVQLEAREVPASVLKDRVAPNIAIDVAQPSLQSSSSRQAAHIPPTTPGESKEPRRLMQSVWNLSPISLVRRESITGGPTKSLKLPSLPKSMQWKKTSASSSSSSSRESNHRRFGSGTIDVQTSDDDGDQSSGAVTRHEFTAPRKGQLGLVIEIDPMIGPVVSAVKDYSPLFGKIRRGDEIVEVDGKDTSHSLLSEVTKLLSTRPGRRSNTVRIVVARRARPSPTTMGISSASVSTPGMGAPVSSSTGMGMAMATMASATATATATFPNGEGIDGGGVVPAYDSHAGSSSQGRHDRDNSLGNSTIGSAGELQNYQPHPHPHQHFHQHHQGHGASMTIDDANPNNRNGRVGTTATAPTSTLGTAPPTASSSSSSSSAWKFLRRGSFYSDRNTSEC